MALYNLYNIPPLFLHSYNIYHPFDIHLLTS
nr:MAG TPA: hypothetical protein [Caudoviricetes sp.]